MRKCLIITYVFGDDYQSFIPFYIYFINAEYPDYDIRLYLDRPIAIKYKKQLEKLNCFGYDIRLFNPQELGLSGKALENYNISRAVRWFLMTEDVQEYDTIYCGDIDILIMHEESGLYEQHIRHTIFLKLPYSNSVRVYEEKNTLRHLLGNIKRYGFRETYATATFPIRKWRRLTGLHFFKTKECVGKIDFAKTDLIRELNLVAEGKSDYWTKSSINDESVLYELMKRAGLGVPEYDETNLAVGKTIVENTNPNSFNFRPHHGLHLALWRSKKVDYEVSLSNIYQSYYEDFLKKYTADQFLQNMIKENNDLAVRLIKNMMSFYSCHC